MKQIYPDLWQTRAEHPFPGVNSHAYLLVRETGNILLYNSSIREEYEHIEALGGVAFQFLSHMDEVGPNLAEIKSRFGSKLCCHRFEESAVRKATSVDYLFDRREKFLGDMEVIPTPGHTAGSVCFYVDSPFGKSYLFTGDTIYLSNHAWEARVNGYGGASKSDLRESLLILQNFAPAVVISSASVGDTPLKEVTADDWRNEIAKVVCKLI